MIIAVIALAVAADRVVPPVIEQIWDARRFRVQNVALGHRLHRAVVVADPVAVADVENVGDVVSLAGFLPIVVHNGKQFVLLLLCLIFIFLRYDFCGKRKTNVVVSFIVSATFQGNLSASRIYIVGRHLRF